MAADSPVGRGPSGTGHDTACPKCGTPGAAYVTHVCMTAGDVPDPPATRWLNPPPDLPPVAVPGPASAPEHVCKPEQTDKRTVTCPVCHAVYVLDDAATSDERSYVDG